MVLTAFEVENHQAIAQASADSLPQLVVIAGPNGVGKSTLLHYLHNRIRRYNTNQDDRYDISCEGETTSVYFSPHRVPGNNSQFNRGDLLGQRRARFRGVLSDDVNLPISGRYPSTRNRSGPDATAFLGLARRMAEFKEQRRSLALDLIDEGESVSSDDLPDVEQPLGDLIDRVVPGISLVGVTEENDNYQLAFENRTGQEVRFEDLSSGEIDIITMLFFVAEQQIERKINAYSGDSDSEEDLTVLIDGPESYLHPYLQLQFIDFLSEQIETESGLQVILVTHSETILNQTDDSNLFYLTYPDMATGNQLRSANEIEIDLLEDILGEIGTASIAAGKPLLLVEGKSDRDILVRLFPELRTSMTVLPMQGKPQIVQLDNAIDRLVPTLLESGIHLHAIVDRDRGSVDISSSNIHELPVTNMENVLLDAEALYETIRSLTDRGDLRAEGIHGPDDVDELLNNISSRDHIKNHEIRKRINARLNFEVGLGASDDLSEDAVLERFDDAVASNRTRIERFLDEIRAEVESASSENELTLFDGSRIIGELAGEFGLQSESVTRLTAEKIRENDTQPDYLGSIVQEISSSTTE